MVLKTYTTGSLPSKATDTSSSELGSLATTVPRSTGEEPYLDMNVINLVTPTLVAAEVQNNGIKL